MSENETPFDSIEGAHEYLRLLSEAIVDAQRDIEADIATASKESRQMEALRLVIYKLNKLESHIGVSRRLLNDLRMLRRLLLQERPRTASNS